MSKRWLALDDPLYDYMLETGGREPEVAARLRAATKDLPSAGMQISPDQGNFMALLVELLDVRRAVEVGTFTGYSALRVALAMPDDGRLTCCDVSDDYTRVGRPFWEEAGIAHKIDLRLAPATETLAAMIEGGAAGTVDLMFIDADKANYDAYYEAALTLLRPGGAVLIDNVLWSRAVIDPSDTSEDTEAIRALNAKIHDDKRVSTAMSAIGDGLTIAMKRR